MKWNLAMVGILISSVFGVSFQAQADAYRIYNIAREIPMSSTQKTRKKNYYLNFGQQEGIQKGTQVNVMRVISTTDPYDGKKRINYKVRVALLEVLHSQEHASIAVVKRIFDDEASPYFDIPAPMIGDLVEVHVGD